VAVGDPGETLAGAAHTFRRYGTLWLEMERVTGHQTYSGDRFGAAIDLTEDYLVIGAPNADGTGSTDSGAVFVFELP
jgi:hypothetical protein